ncbi:hypothetical protein F4778DRAFT_743853 [Xylariomycetidae sp. FL2044]|nr:hypothetical protein F4778DRAFT_743853 [Xylariomycetidae sp. FL2044]
MAAGGGADPGAYMLQEFFDRDQQLRFLAERTMGQGMAGMSIRCKEIGPAGEDMYRFIVKIPTQEETMENLRREAGWLNWLYFAEHIVTPIYIPENPLLQGYGGDLNGFTDAIVIMEYLENGTLSQLLDRKSDLPNRVLWSIFLCLARMSAGMAWPPQGPSADGSWIQERDRPDPPLNLAHRDMHTKNLMFGTVHDFHQEHSLVPILKLIDFDAARPLDFAAPNQEQVDNFDAKLNLSQYNEFFGDADVSPRNGGMDDNILSIGAAMARILVDDHYLSVNELRVAIQDRARIRPEIDNDLILLCQRCLAADPANRPRMGRLVATLVFSNINMKTENYYSNRPSAALETDAAIRDLVQEFILDANIS